MRGALVGRRTTAAGFHMQNMCNVWANIVEYWASKHTNILNTKLREETWSTLTAAANFQIYVRLKKRQNEFSQEAVCSKLLIHAGPASFRN